MRLPTEAEWEKAARYPDGRYYPWGNEYIRSAANIDEKGLSGLKGLFGLGKVVFYSLKQTMAAGIYQQGRNPSLDSYDQAGNVWEWCQSRWREDYRHPEQNAPAGSSPRVLRGGSWRDGYNFAGACARSQYPPHVRDEDIGFRVVVAPLSGF